MTSTIILPGVFYVYQTLRSAPPPSLVVPPLLLRHRLGHGIAANTGNSPLSYANLRLLMRQVDGGDRKWSISLGDAYCLRRVGEAT